MFLLVSSASHCDKERVLHFAINSCAIEYVVILIVLLVGILFCFRLSHTIQELVYPVVCHHHVLGKNARKQLLLLLPTSRVRRPHQRLVLILTCPQLPQHFLPLVQRRPCPRGKRLQVRGKVPKPVLVMVGVVASLVGNVAVGTDTKIRCVSACLPNTRISLHSIFVCVVLVMS